jgi:beta-glucanase (GH16 family)
MSIHSSMRLPHLETLLRGSLAVRLEEFRPRLHSYNHTECLSWIDSTSRTSASWLTTIAMLFAIIAASEVTQASIVSDNPAGWQLTFSDEFSGMSLDDSKWSHRGLGPRRDAINTANAVSVGEGLLTITTYTSGGVHYTGMIGTQGKFEQTFGYYEARMKFHSTPGEWSAFWLQSPTYGAVGDPASVGMEIDVVEHRAANRNDTDIRNRYSSAIHWDGYDAAHQQLSKVHLGLPGMGNDSWHTYGVKWSESGYEYYFDDMLVWTAASPVSARSEYLILSSEVEDGAWAGTVPAGGYGSLASSVTNMQVDYIRAYSAVAPPPSSADFNFDDQVDGSDFLIWQRNAGISKGAIRNDGNANAGVDGDVDADDLTIWKQQYGAIATNVAVPEPPSCRLVALASSLALGSLRRRKHSQRVVATQE